MADDKPPSDESGAPPKESPSVTPDYVKNIMHSDQMQTLMEVQKTLASLDTKVGRLISDMDKHETKIEKLGTDLGKQIGDLNNHVSRSTGIVIGAGAVLAAIWAIVTLVVPLFADREGDPETAPSQIEQTQQQPKPEGEKR